MTGILPLGEAAPFFHARALNGNPRYAFHTAAGRPILLLFHGSGSWPASAAALSLIGANRDLFDDDAACFFGISIDPSDVSDGRIEQMLPGMRWFLDDDRQVSTLYGAVEVEGEEVRYRPHWLLLDPALRGVAAFPIDKGEAAIAALWDFLAETDEPTIAPVLIVPRVFEPELCRRLVEAHQRDGGTDSGFMREANGITVEQTDHSHKRRSDFLVADGDLAQMINARIARRLAPQIKRAFQFDATRIERLLVACYDGDNGGGHFRPHRDNTTKGTAHRRFACTINLNPGDYEGGDLVFPEFGSRLYRAPAGGAIVFSCSLLHEARPVTKGKRYAFLPFFYDDAAARLREQNLPFVAPELQHYRASEAPANGTVQSAEI